MGRRQTEYTSVEVDGVEIPLKIFYENRRNVRVASGKDSVLLRIPRYFTAPQREHYMSWAQEWIYKQWNTNARFRTTYTPFLLKPNHVILTFDAEYGVEWSVNDVERASGKLQNDCFDLTFPDHWSETDVRSTATNMIYTLLGRKYGPAFKDRILAMHEGRFDREIASVKLKNMSSKWGSCSHEGKISLSTRLVFAPSEVQDYIFLHELCHLHIQDHSRRFWNLVASHDPHYISKDRWLRDLGHTCDLTHAYVPGRSGAGPRLADGGLIRQQPRR